MTYFLLIRILKAVMANRKALELRSLVTAHSTFLTITSAALFAGFAVVLSGKAREYTPWEMVCSIEFHEDGRLQANPSRTVGLHPQQVELGAEQRACPPPCRRSTTSTTWSSGTNCWTR